MVAQLGQTADPKQLIPGEPEQIAEDLRGVVGNIGTVGDIGGMLGRIDPANWMGAASNAFRDAFGAEPPRWHGLVDTVARGGQTLADYADVLTWAQGEAQRAIELDLQARAAHRAAAAANPLTGGAQDAAGGMLGEAQAVLDNARGRVDAVGTQLAAKLGLQPDGQGGYANGFEREALHERHRYERTFGGEQNLKQDPVSELVGLLGIELPNTGWQGEATVAVAEGELAGGFDGGVVAGDGSLQGSVLGAGANAEGSLDATGLSAGAGAQAHLAQGGAQGALDLGGVGGVNAEANAAVEAEANANAQLGLTGLDVGADAFAGARADASVGAEVLGISAGLNGEAWAGAGAEAGLQFGMGEDGKFHAGGSLGAAIGVGGRVGGEVAVDPGQVAASVGGAASSVGMMMLGVGGG
ncbi:hypothetical protein BJF85_23820 [Saccharomonospora sp. CUA-673]|uniref:putative T7SS-secreted protein n=1 Tax=Saccharomonospora sp. CUA-673 TaxID=1904969 RepID=UPI0009599571|nr:hypothetical protein [Saccharomonospora sp. CUA-673]OLT41366.1 hypothetical protein BJF85_23820 [Saccharomonospora sp. CUA-673]